MRFDASAKDPSNGQEPQVDNIYAVGKLRNRNIHRGSGRQSESCVTDVAYDTNDLARCVVRT